MAVVVTTAWPGDNLTDLLPRLPDHRRLGLATALGRFVANLHQRGFRDRNLDLRNLLARECADGTWELCKIDSGRFQLARPGQPDDALARADWARLLPQLTPFGITEHVRAAAAAHLARAT
jgi:hypothetical protein